MVTLYCENTVIYSTKATTKKFAFLVDLAMRHNHAGDYGHWWVKRHSAEGK